MSKIIKKTMDLLDEVKRNKDFLDNPDSFGSISITAEDVPQDKLPHPGDIWKVDCNGKVQQAEFKGFSYDGDKWWLNFDVKLPTPPPPRQDAKPAP